MKSEPYTSECSLSFPSETTKDATPAPLINLSRWWRRFLCQQSHRICFHFLPAIFFFFWQSFWKTDTLDWLECWEYVNRPSARTSASAREQSTPFCGGAGSWWSEANTGLCFLTEMVPLEGGSTVGQLGEFFNFNGCGFSVQFDAGQPRVFPSISSSCHQFGFKVERKCRIFPLFLSPELAAAMFHPCCRMSHGMSFSLNFFSAPGSLPSLFLFPAVLLFSVSGKGSAMDTVTVVFLLSFTWKF